MEPYNWLLEQYKTVQTDDMYKLEPFCVGNNNEGKPCEYCHAERLHDDRWVLRCDKKYNGWNNLKCPLKESEKELRK
jgi:hypothetical protein